MTCWLACWLACLLSEPCSEEPPEVGDGSRHARLLRCRASQADQGAVRGPRSWAALSSRVVAGSGSQPRRREEEGGDETRRREDAKMGPFSRLIPTLALGAAPQCPHGGLLGRSRAPVHLWWVGCWAAAGPPNPARAPK